MNYIEKVRLGNGYNELLKNNNTRYFMTVTFKNDITNKDRSRLVPRAIYPYSLWVGLPFDLLLK